TARVPAERVAVAAEALAEAPLLEEERGDPRRAGGQEPPRLAIGGRRLGVVGGELEHVAERLPDLADRGRADLPQPPGGGQRAPVELGGLGGRVLRAGARPG